MGGIAGRVWVSEQGQCPPLPDHHPTHAGSPSHTHAIHASEERHATHHSRANSGVELTAAIYVILVCQHMHSMTQVQAVVCTVPQVELYHERVMHAQMSSQPGANLRDVFTDDFSGLAAGQLLVDLTGGRGRLPVDLWFLKEDNVTIRTLCSIYTRTRVHGVGIVAGKHRTKQTTISRKTPKNNILSDHHFVWDIVVYTHTHTHTHRNGSNLLQMCVTVCRVTMHSIPRGFQSIIISDEWSGIVV